MLGEKGKGMNVVEQLSALLLLVDFLFGVSCGVLGGASHGSRREDREYTLLRGAQDAVSDGARVLHALYIRDDGYLERLLSARGGDFGQRLQAGDPAAWPGEEPEQ